MQWSGTSICIKTLFLFSKALKWEGEDQYCSDERRFSFNRNLSQYYYLHTSMFTCVERLIFCVDLYTYIRFETIDVLRKQYVSKNSIQDSHTQYGYYINFSMAISCIAWFVKPHMCKNWQSNFQSMARRYYFFCNWIKICTLLKYWLWNILDARVKHRLMMQCSVSSSFVDNVPSFLWKNLSLDKAVNLHNILYFFMSPSLICTYVASSIYNKAWVTLTCTHICSYF